LFDIGNQMYSFEIKENFSGPRFKLTVHNDQLLPNSVIYETWIESHIKDSENEYYY